MDTRVDLDLKVRKAYYLILDVPEDPVISGRLHDVLQEDGWTLTRLGDYARNNSLMHKVCLLPIDGTYEYHMRRLKREILELHLKAGHIPNPDNWGVGTFPPNIYVQLEYFGPREVQNSDIDPILRYWGEARSEVTSYSESEDTYHHIWYLQRTITQDKVPSEVTWAIEFEVRLDLHLLGYNGTLESDHGYWLNSLTARHWESLDAFS